MSRTVTMAAVRLSNVPAPTETRLRQAEVQIAAAAGQGAQLVVLPEVFNTGYVYSDDNYACAESIDGPTVTWMKRIAAEHGVHLAGSLMLLGTEDITNSLLLVAPDGRIWRYDKNFPWVWERAYFREGRDITVAQTDIGTFGLMICIDVSVPNLYRRYAGRVEALIISSSPPRVDEFILGFPDGTQVSMQELMPMTRAQRARAAGTFGENVRAFSAWMGVPHVQATPYGTFCSHMPVPRLSLAVLLAGQPRLWRYVLQGPRATLTASYFNNTQIADAAGTVLASYDQEADGFALATVELPETPPKPRGRLPLWAWQSALMSASFESLSWFMIPYYRRNVRRVWGRQMARPDHATHNWIRVLAAVGGLCYLAGRLCAGRRSKKKQ